MSRPRLYLPEELPESFETVPGMMNLPPEPVDPCCRLQEIIYDPDAGLELLVIQPPSPPSGRKLPCILFVQGSAWRRQKLLKNIPHLLEFSKRGYEIVLPRYRPSDMAPFPAQIRDIRAAAAFFSSQAENYGADPKRIFLWGDSSGGHTALMAAFTAADPDFGPVCPFIRAVVDYYAPINLIEMSRSPSTIDHWSPDSPEGLLFGRLCVPEHPELSDRADPRQYLHPAANPPPVLILHGSKDRLVPFRQSILLYESLQKAGVPCRFYRLAGSDHGGEDFWRGTVLDLVDGFLKKSC